MDISQIVEKLQTSQPIEKEQPEQTIKEEVKLLIFSIKEQKYAVHAEQVKEIVFDSEIFFAPFVPAYILGYINRHGEPYTVFDLNALFYNEKSSATKFLILNLENDQVAIMITDILEIVAVDKVNIRHLTSDSLSNKLFLGSFTVQNSEVFIIHIPTILERLENDL